MECLGLVQAGQGAALDRTRGRDHVTASCFVLSPDLGQVLLTLHRKVGLWLQLGGHLQAGDATVIDAARREAREESGIAGLDLATHDLVDLERQDVGHALTACSVHWDAGYLAIADRRTPTIDQRREPTAAVVADRPATRRRAAHPGAADRTRGRGRSGSARIAPGAVRRCAPLGRPPPMVVEIFPVQLAGAAGMAAWRCPLMPR